MDLVYSDDPIIACSTNSLSPSAINVVRLSGFQNFAPIEPFLSIKSSQIKPRYAHYCKVIDDSRVLDDVVLVYFPAPKSYNGENILELSVHGNPLLTQNIINLFVEKAGFRIAKPGEFSFRALRNKKLSLSQVEGLDLLLNANNKYALEHGRSFLSGDLYELYLKLQKTLLTFRSSLEILTDFSDDVGEEQAWQNIKNSFRDFSQVVKGLSSKTQSDYSQLIESKITLLGLPNAGKSTIFNSLLKQNRAIVSDIKGTTRDYITEKIKIRDNFYFLVDTAGVRESKNNIEKLGIDQSLSLARNSFFNVLVINPFEWDEGYFKKLKEISFDLIFITHTDREGFSKALAPIEPLLPKIDKIYLKIEASSFSFEQFESFKNLVSKKMESIINKKPLLLDRHVNIINMLDSEVDSYSQLLKEQTDIGILSSEFLILEKTVAELIGIVSPNDVLHHIFNNFCIGK